MATGGPGSAIDMEHEFTHPARVVEIGRGEAQEEDSDNDEFLPPVPPATDDGTPIMRVVQRPAREPR